MSDFLAAAGRSRRCSGYDAEHITARPRSRRRRQRDLARQPRARGSARSQDPLLLAARGDPRALPLGRALDRHRRHARQDDDDVADRLAADARRRRSERARRRHRATTSASRLELSVGRAATSSSKGDEYDSAFFDKTAKFLKYLPDIAVVNNIEFDHADIYPDLDAIRLAFRRLVNLVPRRGLLLLGADNAEALALASGARCRVETFGLSRRRRLAGARSRSRPAASTRFSVRRSGTPFGTFELPLLGAYNVRNALAAIAVGAAVGHRAPTRWPTGCARSTASSGGSSSRHGRRRHGLRRLRASSDRGRRDAGRRARRASRSRGSGRSSSRARRRRAGACSRTTSRARSPAADASCCRAVFRSTLPEDRAAVGRAAGRTTCKAAGKDARYIPTGRRHRRRPSRASAGTAISSW